MQEQLIKLYVNVQKIPASAQEKLISSNLTKPLQIVQPESLKQINDIQKQLILNLIALEKQFREIQQMHHQQQGSGQFSSLITLAGSKQSRLLRSSAASQSPAGRNNNFAKSDSKSVVKQKMQKQKVFALDKDDKAAVQCQKFQAKVYKMRLSAIQLLELSKSHEQSLWKAAEGHQTSFFHTDSGVQGLKLSIKSKSILIKIHLFILSLINLTHESKQEETFMALKKWQVFDFVKFQQNVEKLKYWFIEYCEVLATPLKQSSVGSYNSMFNVSYEMFRLTNLKELCLYNINSNEQYKHCATTQINFLFILANVKMSQHLGILKMLTEPNKTNGNQEYKGQLKFMKGVYEQSQVAVSKCQGLCKQQLGQPQLKLHMNKYLNKLAEMRFYYKWFQQNWLHQLQKGGGNINLPEMSLNLLPQYETYLLIHCCIDLEQTQIQYKERIDAHKTKNLNSEHKLQNQKENIINKFVDMYNREITRNKGHSSNIQSVRSENLQSLVKILQLSVQKDVTQNQTNSKHKNDFSIADKLQKNQSFNCLIKFQESQTIKNGMKDNGKLQKNQKKQSFPDAPNNRQNQKIQAVHRSQTATKQKLISPKNKFQSEKQRKNDSSKNQQSELLQKPATKKSKFQQVSNSKVKNAAVLQKEKKIDQSKQSHFLEPVNQKKKEQISMPFDKPSQQRVIYSGASLQNIKKESKSEKQLEKIVHKKNEKSQTTLSQPTTVHRLFYQIIQILNVCRHGQWLTKYNFNNNSYQVKYVRLSYKSNKLSWSNDKQDAIENADCSSYKLSKVSGIVFGDVTQKMRYHVNKQKGKGNLLQPWQCFSLICQDRTLDFYCHLNEYDIYFWLEGLSFHLRSKNKKTVNFSRGKILWKKSLLKMRYMYGSDKQSKKSKFYIGRDNAQAAIRLGQTIKSKQSQVKSQKK